VRVVFVAHGEAGDEGWARERLAAADRVIAADGGAATARRLGRPAEEVIGDLDSLDPAEARAAIAAGAVLHRRPRDKDETDFELALQLAVRRGATTIEVIGALGGARLDHALANVLALAQPSLEGLAISLGDGRHEVRLLRGPATLELTGRSHDLVTLLPLSERAEGITTRGLRYPLHDEALELGRTRGVSNELLDRAAAISLRRGVLLVVTHRSVAGSAPAGQ
jgi:thiamine pyrophosphokinase